MANIVGGTKRATVTFIDNTANGVNVDPATIIIRWKSPTTSLITKTFGVDTELIKDSVGVYHIDISLTEVGTWWVQAKGTGTINSTDIVTFTVQDATPVG